MCLTLDNTANPALLIISCGIVNPNPARQIEALDELYNSLQNIGRASRPDGRDLQMAGISLSVVLLIALIVASILCILGPVAALGVMFWHWHRELKETARVRQARSTQIR